MAGVLSPLTRPPLARRPLAAALSTGGPGTGASPRPPARSTDVYVADRPLVLQELPCGAQYQDLVFGKGAAPVAGQEVRHARRGRGTSVVVLCVSFGV